jgi:hypothetical protein
MLPSLTESEERSLFDQFQSKMMAYRLCHHQQVQEFEVPADVKQSGFDGEMKRGLRRSGSARTPAFRSAIIR